MKNEKTKSVIAYIFGLIGGLIILFMKDNERNTRFHATQSITIFIGYYLINFVYGFIPFTIPFFEYVLNGIYIIAIIIGIVKACSDENPEIPVIGDLAKAIFKKQIDN